MGDSSALPVPRGASLRLIPRSDSKLARLAATGDERAFAAIYERFHQELYRYCRAILADPDDAHDALQNTMASALRSLPGETRDISLRPWLYRVARNEAVSVMRRRSSLAEPDDATMPSSPAADVVAEDRQRLRALVSDLASLPERQRSALVMRELSGLTYEQIGEALTVSGGGARQVVYEARQALQTLAEGRGMECEEVRQAISARDGRVMRGRKIRAHLRTCDGCSDFRRGIETRHEDLRMLAPPLPAVAASGVLAAVLGGGSVKVGALGGLFTGGVSGGAIGIKSLSVVAATAAIGVGAGSVAGVPVSLPGSGDSGKTPSSQAQPASNAPAAVPAAGPGDAARSGQQRSQGGPGVDGRRAQERASGRSRQRGEAPTPQSPASPAAEGSAAGGASAAAPAGTGRPETPPGSEVAGARSQGKSASPVTGAPGKSAPPAAPKGPPEHSQAGGVGPR